MNFLKKLFKKKDVEDVIVEVKLEKITNNIVSLVEFAVENDIHILVGNQGRIDFIKELSPDAKVFGFAKNYTKNVAQAEHPNGVIIDKSVSEEMVEYLKTELSHIKIVE